MQSWSATLTSLGRETVRIVLPSPCVVCGEELPWRSRRGSCCSRCWDRLPRLEPPPCRRCGRPRSGTPAAEGWLCAGCASQPPEALGWIAAWGSYSAGLERVIHAFKYQRHDFLAAPLAALQAEALSERPETPHLLVPVPMLGRRERERGYNQADLLSGELSNRTGLPSVRALKKVGTGPPQSTLPREKRAENVRRAFVPRIRLAGEHVLLVDDVATTGETLRACARALVDGGAGAVGAVVIARA